MKALLLAFLALSGMGYGAATNPIVLLPLNADALDTSGNGYNFTNNGSVPFVSSPTPCNGTGMAGGFSDASYFSAPAGFRVAIASQTNWTAQFYVYLTNTVGGPIAFSFDNNGAPNFLQLTQAGPTYIRFFGGGVALDVTHTAAIYNLNECIHFAIVINATAGTRSIYMNGVFLKSDTNASSSATAGTVNSLYLGRYTASTGFFTKGYVDNFRWDNVALSPPFPTPTSSVVIPGALSPYVSNSNRPLMSPAWFFK